MSVVVIQWKSLIHWLGGGGMVKLFDIKGGKLVREFPLLLCYCSPAPNC